MRLHVYEDGMDYGYGVEWNSDDLSSDLGVNR